MPVSGVGATAVGDRFDFAVRELLPGRELAGLEGVPGAPPLLSDLAALDLWRRERRLPQIWAERLRSLSRLLPQPSVPESAVDRDQVHVWRSTTAALRGFEEALRQIEAFLPAREMLLERSSEIVPEDRTDAWCLRQTAGVISAPREHLETRRLVGAPEHPWRTVVGQVLLDGLSRGLRDV